MFLTDLPPFILHPIFPNILLLHHRTPTQYLCAFVSVMAMKTPHLRLFNVSTQAVPTTRRYQFTSCLCNYMVMPSAKLSTAVSSYQRCSSCKHRGCTNRGGIRTRLLNSESPVISPHPLSSSYPASSVLLPKVFAMAHIARNGGMNARQRVNARQKSTALSPWGPLS